MILGKYPEAAKLLSECEALTLWGRVRPNSMNTPKSGPNAANALWSVPGFALSKYYGASACRDSTVRDDQCSPQPQESFESGPYGLEKVGQQCRRPCVCNRCRGRTRSRRLAALHGGSEMLLWRLVTSETGRQPNAVAPETLQATVHHDAPIHYRRHKTFILHKLSILAHVAMCQVTGLWCRKMRTRLI